MEEIFWTDKAGCMQQIENGVYWWNENIPAGVAIGHLAAALYHYMEG